LDETLRETECLERFPHAAALILKPTILGDVSAMQPLTSLGIPLVFSGAFESGIGTLAVARLSNRYAPGVPAGLDAHARLESDVLAQRLSVQSGDLLIPARVTVDFSRLTEVERHSRS
jgi:O-succinylbenzoate synthase